MPYSTLRFLPSILVKNRPIHLTFFVTRKCNQKCPFCFYLSSDVGGSGGAGGPDAPEMGPEMELDEIGKFSSSLGSLLWLAFSGGEVFLRKDIVEISEIFYKNNKPSIMLYPTNGMAPGLIKEKISSILKLCPESTIVLKLSMDGVGEKHDRLRGSPGSFERVMETYGALSGLASEHRNFELGVNTVFCSKNEDDMDEVTGFVKKLDRVKTHTISLVRGEVGNPGYKDVSLEKYIRAAKKLERAMKDGTSPIYRFRGAKVKAAQDILQRRLIHKTVAEDRRQLPCFAGKLNLVVTESGDVFPCENFGNRTGGNKSGGKKLGNLRDFGYNAQALLCSKAARDIVSAIRKNKCFCSHECYFITNILFNPSTYPALLREYLSL